MSSALVFDQAKLDNEFFCALMARDYEDMEKFLRQGANINQRVPGFTKLMTPVISAVGDKNAVLLQWLLKHGASPDNRDQPEHIRFHEAQPLTLAIAKGWEDGAQLLLGNKPEFSHGQGNRGRHANFITLNISPLSLFAPKLINDSAIKS